MSPRLALLLLAQRQHHQGEPMNTMVILDPRTGRLVTITVGR